jgi:hypothetical protein
LYLDSLTKLLVFLSQKVVLGETRLLYGTHSYHYSVLDYLVSRNSLG